MKMRRIDHLVLTVSDLEASKRFYHEVFDMPVIDDQTNDDVVTLRCGHQLIRLQKTDRANPLVAKHPTVGAADFCMIVGDQLEDVLHHLKSYYVDVITDEPIVKHGSEGEIRSIYLYDPDQNLLEISTYSNK